MNKVVFDNIKQVEGVVDLLEEGKGGALRLVDVSPLIDPSAEGLILPQAERFLVHNCWLNHFSIHEDAPGYSVDVVVVQVVALHGLSPCVDCLVADRSVLVEVLDKGCDELRRHKELEVGLLVDVAFSGTPSEDRIC